MSYDLLSDSIALHKSNRTVFLSYSITQLAFGISLIIWIILDPTDRFFRIGRPLYDLGFYRFQIMLLLILSQSYLYAVLFRSIIPPNKSLAVKLRWKIITSENYSLSDYMNLDFVLVLIYNISDIMLFYDTGVPTDQLILIAFIFNFSFNLLIFRIVRRGKLISRQLLRESKIYFNMILLLSIIVSILVLISFYDFAFSELNILFSSLSLLGLILFSIAIFTLDKLESKNLEFIAVKIFEEKLEFETEQNFGKLSGIVNTMPSSLHQSYTHLNYAFTILIISFGVISYSLTIFVQGINPFIVSVDSIMFYFLGLIAIILLIPIILINKSKKVLKIKMYEFSKVMRNFEETNREFLEILDERD